MVFDTGAVILQTTTFNQPNYSGKGKAWHFHTLENGLHSPEKNAKHPLPKKIEQEFLPNYSQIAAMRRYSGKPRDDSGNYVPDIVICALPKKGGDYLLLRANATNKDVKLLETEEGITSLIERLL